MKAIKFIFTMLILFTLFIIVGCRISAGVYKGIMIERYKKEDNVILRSRDFKVTNYLDETGYTGYRVEYVGNKKLRSNYFTVDYQMVVDADSLPGGIYEIGEKEYIINNLLYDKSKGNNFEKIDKYIQDNKERIFKIFLEEDWQYGVDIKIKLNILGSIDFDKKKEEFYDFEGQNIKIVDNSIEEIETFNSNYYDLRYEREKLFFNKLIKFENINWNKYMSYMGDYPILRIVIFEDRGVDPEDKSPIMNEITVDDPKEKVEKLKEFYKELEQFYNTDTFRFVIRDSELF